MKKLLSLFVMMLTATMAWAESYVVVDGVRYATESWYDYAYVVAPETGTYTGEITIQASVSFEGIDEPKPVKEIGREAFKGSTITKVTIPASVEEIREYAFQDCAQLTTVVLNEGLKIINSEAFKNCTSLTSITLPDGLQDIGSNSFEASGLTSVTLPGSLAFLRLAAFKDCTSLTSITMAYTPLESLPDDGWFLTDMKGVLSSDGGVFEGCTSLTDVTINRNWNPNYNSSPFENLNVKHVTIGDHVTAITERTFQGLNFESLSIGTGVTEIGNYAFQNASLPTGYAFPFSQIKKIGYEAFRECKNLPATVTLSQVEEIGGNAFQNCEDITSLTIGGGTIDYYAFYGCSNIATITLNEGVTEIGSSNFSGLTNLTSINIPSTMKKIGGGAFYDCTNLTIPNDLPYGLEEIGSYAFYNCKKLNVTIPATVTRIEQGAFCGCEALTNVTIPAAIKEMEGSTFSGCTGLTTITIPGNVTYIGYYDFGGCTNLAEVKFEKGESTLTIGGQGYAFSSSPCTTLYINRNIKAGDNYNFQNTENVTFGPDCTEIGDRVFEGSTSLKKVTMTDNIKRIGVKAFNSAMVEGEFTLSQKLETIGDHAFGQFQGFTSFTLPITVAQIGVGAFHRYSWYEQLNDVYVPWLTPLELEDDEPENETTWMFNYTNENMTLWVPGGTMDAYKAATIWKKFPKFDFWSFVVNATVAGKGSLKLSNGEAVTDNGTNTEKTATNDKLVSEGAGEAVGGLFVREKDLVLTPSPARGYELTALTANEATVAAAEGTYAIAKLTADQAIKGTFTPIIYKLTYDLGGGALADGEENPATYTVEDAAITLKNPTRRGYTFEGWTGTELEGAMKEVTIAANSIGDRTYTATWKPIVYDLKYDLAGGALAEGKVNPATYTIETADFTLVNPARRGYSFEGWTGTDLAEATKEVTIAKGSIGERSFTATWKVITYTITYDLAGGALADGETNTAEYTVESDDIKLKNPTRANYEFVGWTGTDLATATMEVTIAKGSIENRTYTATWKPVNFMLTYDLAGGAMADGQENPAEYNIETEDFTLKTPVLNHYEFAGWTGTGLTEATKEVIIAKGSIGERSYTATWTPCIYKVNINKTGEGSVVAVPEKAPYTESVELTITPAENYLLTKVTVDGQDVTADIKDGKYTIANVSADVAVSVEFTLDIIPGDVNHDGVVNITDVTMTIDYILGRNPEGFVMKAADVNNDDEVNIVDVTSIIDIILGVKAE